MRKAWGGLWKRLAVRWRKGNPLWELWCVGAGRSSPGDETLGNPPEIPQRTRKSLPFAGRPPSETHGVLGSVPSMPPWSPVSCAPELFWPPASVAWFSAPPILASERLAVSMIWEGMGVFPIAALSGAVSGNKNARTFLTNFF